MMGEPTVRSLRFRLACALAGDAGESPRRGEALGELDRALNEEGSEPTSAEIQLTAGGLLETTEPASALVRYAAALEGKTAQEAAGRARRLLGSAARPSALAASIPGETIEKITRFAMAEPGSDAVPLAATVLLGRGDAKAALDVLEHAYQAATVQSPEVVAQLAETLLTVDRLDEAIDLVQAHDPAARDGRLQTVGAAASLLEGAFDVALEMLSRINEHALSPMALAVRALSFLGLQRDDEAVDGLPQSGPREILFANAIVRLHRDEYALARDATRALIRLRPDDPDVLLINAQTVVEALGAADASDADTTPVRGGAEIDAARELLSQIAPELPGPDARPLWWRAQRAVRSEHSRFRFFCVELQHATGAKPAQADLDGIYIWWATTYLQDAALEEIKAILYTQMGDADRAATALEEAARIFTDHVPDPHRAWTSARGAFEKAPSPSRAADYATRTVFAAYAEDLDETVPAEDLDSARRDAESSLDAAEEEDFVRLIYAIAWLRVKLADTEENPSAVSRLPWLLAAVTVRPDDVSLRGTAAWDLNDIWKRATATVLAERAVADAPDDFGAVTTALALGWNYYAEPERIGHLLRNPLIADNEDVHKAFELALCLDLGDRDGLERVVDLPSMENPEAVNARALALAILRGIPAATEELADALEGNVSTVYSRLEWMVIAGALGLVTRVTQLQQEIARDPDSPASARGLADCINRFIADDRFGADEFLKAALPQCVSRTDALTLVNVYLPLLLAKRAGITGPVPPADVNGALVRSNLDRFGDPYAAWPLELGDLPPSVSLMARLAVGGEAGELLASVDATEISTDDLLAPSVAERVARLAVEQAARELPRRLLDELRLRGPRVSPDEVFAVLNASGRVSPPTRVAAALLAGPERRNHTGLAFTLNEDELAVTAEILLAMIPLVVVDDDDESTDTSDQVADYWAIDAELAVAEGDPELPSVLRHAAQDLRSRFGLRLSELLGLDGPDEDFEVPLVLPIVVEVGEALVPLVDSRQDEGVFLYQHIPAMRERILAATGVNVPGVRMRQGFDLPPDGYRIHVDEIPAAIGTIPLALQFEVTPADAGDAGRLFSDFHPLTGQIGIWTLTEHDVDGATNAGSDSGRLGTAQLLIFEIEHLLRDRLSRYLGVEEVNDLVDAWRGDAPELVELALADADALARVTWLLQALVDERVPITNWQSILTAVVECGGVSTPLPTVLRSVRLRLRDQLPGPQSGRTGVAVPAEYYITMGKLTQDQALDAGRNGRVREFLDWLRQTVSRVGPGVALVVGDPESRESVARLARNVNGLVTALSEEEVRPDA